MSKELEDKIKKDIFTAKWSDLQRHYALGSVYLLDGEVDMLELSIAVASDDAEKIKALLESGKMGQIPDDLAKNFAKDNSMFQCSIIQPFVFVQTLESQAN